MITLTDNHPNTKIDRTKVNFFQKFFTLKKPFDFNTLAFFLDRKEYGNEYFTNGKINLKNFDMFQEGKEFCNIVSELNSNQKYQKIDTYIFASLSKLGLSANHDDVETVFLFSVLGSVIYNIYSEKDFTSFYCNVGDLLVIPKGVIHSAIPLCPRIVVSVGVYD